MTTDELVILGAAIGSIIPNRYKIVQDGLQIVWSDGDKPMLGIGKDGVFLNETMENDLQLRLMGLCSWLQTPVKLFFTVWSPDVL